MDRVAARHARDASIRPRLFSRGNARDAPWMRGTGIRLQFGHGSSAVETELRAVDPFRAGRLQFGHGSSAVETRQLAAWRDGRYAASIRPRLFSRGNRPLPIPLAHRHFRSLLRTGGHLLLASASPFSLLPLTQVVKEPCSRERVGHCRRHRGARQAAKRSKAANWVVVAPVPAPKSPAPAGRAIAPAPNPPAARDRRPG